MSQPGRPQFEQLPLEKRKVTLQQYIFIIFEGTTDHSVRDV
jgi:hypothetical protein